MSTAIHYISGASAMADLRGLASLSVPLGVSIPHLSAPALAMLCEHAGMSLLRVFVDSGAFSEVDTAGAAVKPITDAAWCARVRVMHVLAAAYGPVTTPDMGPRLLVVAPDKVGDQRETLRRLALHADAMRACHALGAQVVVPIQRGEMKAAEFDVEAGNALGFTGYVRGIPGNKIAMPEAELCSFLRARRPRAVHLLGVGPRSAAYRPLMDVIDWMIPGAAVSCDSNTLAASVGHTNGRGKGPRLLTDWQEHFEGRVSRVASPPRERVEAPREAAVKMTFGPPALFARFVEMHGGAIGMKPTVPPLQRGLFDGVSEDV